VLASADLLEDLLVEVPAAQTDDIHERIEAVGLQVVADAARKMRPGVATVGNEDPWLPHGTLRQRIGVLPRIG
jgi:hypothetical protein